MEVLLPTSYTREDFLEEVGLKEGAVSELYVR